MKNNLLIIDDSDQVRAEVRKNLQGTGLFNYIYEASDGVEGFKMLLNKKVDMVLCDVVMPGIDGFRFLSMKASRPEYSEIPVIMLTSQEEVKVKVRCFDEGATDYITKPFDARELVARVKVHLQIKNLQDELRESNKKLEELSNTDGLTKIYNRRYFTELVELEFQRAKRYGSKLSYLMLDIDHFKPVNDQFGHLIGDRLLVSVAGILESNLRRHDVLGRYGGDEFALIMPETDLDGALVVAERHRSQIEAYSMPYNDSKINVTVSLGIASMPPSEPDTVDELLRYADEALLLAKKNGKNRIEIAEYETKHES